jgi:hypothetical protein
MGRIRRRNGHLVAIRWALRPSAIMVRTEQRDAFQRTMAWRHSPRRRGFPGSSVSMENAMSSNRMRCTLVGGAVVALAILTLPLATAATESVGVAATEQAPVVVAQAAAPMSAIDAAVSIDEHPAYQRGVRKAAAEGPEALRRYIWRTRMIYNFYYNDFAPRE